MLILTYCMRLSYSLSQSQCTVRHVRSKLDEARRQCLCLVIGPWRMSLQSCPTPANGMGYFQAWYVSVHSLNPKDQDLGVYELVTVPSPGLWGWTATNHCVKCCLRQQYPAMSQREQCGCKKGSKTTSWWWIYLYYLSTSVCSSVYGFIIIICIYTAANAWRYVVMSPLHKMIFIYTCPLVHPHAWFIHRCDWCVILFRWSLQYVLRMGHGNKVSTLAMAVGDWRCLWDSERSLEEN